ncbi:hypothetical protein GQ457_16G013350 [Hibiscus cannabinus]
MAHSISKPRFFNDKIIEDDSLLPQKRVEDIPVLKDKNEWSVQENKQMELNSMAMNILFVALDPKKYVKISSCADAMKI